MKKVRIVSLLMAVLMVCCCMFSAVISVSAATSQSGDVVYFDNTITGYSKVYAYMWKDGVGANANFPGELMTKVDGNIWGYTIKGSYDKIIFTQGNSSGQSDDLTYGGNGMLATPRDNGRFQVDWSEYKGNVTLPTSATVPTSESSQSPTTPSESTPSQSEERVVYCKNDKGWSKINAYLWNSGEDYISAWPGKAMTDLGDGVFELRYSKAYDNIIFNNGSEQTGDLVIPSNANCYNNSTGKWETYVPSAIRINSFTTSRTSPCYSYCDIVLSADAVSKEGEVSYKFIVDDGAGETVLSQGSNNSVVWVPVVAGTYTIKVVVTDTAGNSIEESREFVIENVSELVKPFIKAFSNSLGTDNEIKKDTSVVFTMDALGGNTGTGLLFYKFEITEPDNSKNIPYYTTSNMYSYTPAKLGTHQVKVSVQNSDNTTVTDTYTYDCVENLSETPDVQEVKGDVNSDGVFTIRDATMLQSYLVKDLDNINTEKADVDKDGRISIRDVSLMQMVLAKDAEFE